MPTAWTGRDAIQAQAAYLIGGPRLRILLRCGLASPRLASPCAVPLHRIFFLLRPTTRGICLHHRHSLTPNKVQTPSTKPEGASSPLFHRSIHLSVSVASELQP